jgi:2-methylcitrate dehydratase PrpD
MKLNDGRELSKERKYPIGSPHEPLTMEQVKQLYDKFVRGLLPEETIRSTADSILNLEKLPNLSALMDALAFARAH